MTTIETPRLTLRPWRAADFEAYAAMHADPEVVRYLSADGATWSRAVAWRHLATVVGHWMLRGFGTWAVEERATGELAGRVGCWQPEGWPGFEVGWLLRRTSWGRGYAREATTAALDHAFTVLGRERVISAIHPENARSIRLATRLGERLEGDAEIQGVRVLVYGIRRDEWARVAGGQ